MITVISKKDGIHFDLDFHLVADSASSKGDLNFVSHAHFDHLGVSRGKILCSRETEKLAEKRKGRELESIFSHEKIELIHSGHVLGSRSALVDPGGEKVLYTGDFSPRDRLFLEGFDPVEADILVMETTYGVPAYTFPGQREIENRIIEWIESNSRPLVLFGYSLGKAQKIQKIVENSTERRIRVHEAVHEMNEAYEEASGLEFAAEPFDGGSENFGPEDVLVAPPSAAGSKDIRELVSEHDALKAGFSGWAVDESYSYRMDLDRGFPLSDHADFEELVRTVEEVDPERVYTHHGFDEAFASYLRKEKKVDAIALKKNQARLEDF